MRKLFKKLAVVFIFIISFIFVGRNELIHVSDVYADENKEGHWIQEGENWWYRYTDGSYPQSTWLEINSNWYYFNEYGLMERGWVEVSGKWYHLNSSGAMEIGWIEVSGKWYYLNSSGAMEIGWVEVSEKWYYLDLNGVMETGWLRLKNKWYYFDNDGVMVTGKICIDNIDYNFDDDGSMQYAGDKIISLYGSKYPNDIDTTGDVENVKDIMEKYGQDFFVLTYINPDSTKFTSNNNYINAANMNTGIFFYSGHGGVGYISLRYGNLYSNQLPNMNNSLVSFFFCCHSAENDGNIKSIIKSAVDKGAKSAYGYNGISYVPEDEILERIILENMLKGDSLEIAVNKAKGECPHFVVVNDRRIRIEGDIRTKLRRYDVKSDNTNKNKHRLEDFIKDNIKDQFKADGNIYHRYYKGVMTDDYYIVDNDGYVIDYKSTINDEDLKYIENIMKQNKDGSKFDDVIKNNILDENSKINCVFSAISKDENINFIRKYYISDKRDNKINTVIEVDVKTGKVIRRK